MLIKRSVFDKLIKAYPDKGMSAKTVINGEMVTKPNMWNFFDTLHECKKLTLVKTLPFVNYGKI